MATGTEEALGAALAPAEAEPAGVAFGLESQALRLRSSANGVNVWLARLLHERAEIRGWIEGLLVFDSSSFVMRPPGVAQHNADHRNSGASRPRGRASRYRSRVSVCSLLSLLPPAAACSRRSEIAPVPSEARPPPNTTAPSPEPAGLERTRVFSVGQQATGAGYLLTVKRVLECSGREGWRPQPDRLFLGVELEAAARDESIAIGHSHVKLRYGASPAIGAEPFVKTEDCEPLLKYTRLAAHESVAAWVVFSIPQSASSLELRVRPRQFLNDQATFFDLGR